MKNFVIAVVLCLVPSVTLCAQEIEFNGTRYQLQTINPVSVDAYGRLIQLQPMTILVPVVTDPSTTVEAEENRAAAPTRPARRQAVTSSAMRFANLDTYSAADVQRPSYSATSEVSPSTVEPAENNRKFASSPKSSSVLLDSRLHARNVF